MMYTYNHFNYVDAFADEAILNASIALAKAEAAKGWRLSTVQWATSGHSEYAHMFSDASPDGFEDWGDAPWDERFWGVLIIDDDGQRDYTWDYKAQKFIPTPDDNGVEPIDEAE